MASRDPIPLGFRDLEPGMNMHEDIEFNTGDMIKIAESAIQCFEAAVENSDNVIAETLTYKGIRHENRRRTTPILLGLKGQPISGLEITIPRKDSGTAITIAAQGSLNPNRKFIFTEITNDTDPHAEEYGDVGNFRIDDTDGRNAELANMSVDDYMTRDEVARWLYYQSGMEADDIEKALKTETDPVQDAAHLLGTRAEQVINQRVVNVNVRENLTFYGEEISVQSPDEVTEIPTASKPVGPPKARPIRLYNIWTNTVHDSDAYGGVKETLACSFSPDDKYLLVPNPRAHLSLTVETTMPIPAIEQAQLFLERRSRYDGNVPTLLDSIYQDIRENH
jgi:hypothetical protein